MEPQVFFSVCYNNKAPANDIQARHNFVPAVLHGYSRRRVHHADYPGMTEDADHSVFGMVVSGITRDNLDRLDYLSVQPVNGNLPPTPHPPPPPPNAGPGSRRGTVPKRITPSGTLRRVS